MTQAYDSKFTTEQILSKVRGLIRLAEGASTESEAAAARAKAEEMMLRYRVAEEELIAVDPISIMPILSTIDISTLASKFWQQYLDLFGVIARHCGVRSHYEWDINGRGTGSARRLIANVVGYETDIRYAEMLFTEAQMVLSNRMEPKVNPLASDADNVYALRSAGIERNRIARMLWDLDTHAAHARVGTLYREACAARGENAAVSGRQINAKTYRLAYAEQFISTFSTRLYRAQDAAGARGGTMVLAGRSERVDEAFYKAFPDYRPAKLDADEQSAKKSRRKGWTKADEAQRERLLYGPAASVARRAGEAAAMEVSLRGPERTPQVDRYTDEERDTSRAIWAAIEGN